MQVQKKILTRNLIAFLILGALGALLGMAGIGLAGIILGCVDVLIFLFYLVTAKKDMALSFLLCAGILFLIGFSVCSAFPVNLH